MIAMHSSVRRWVADQAELCPTFGPVLEVGSRDVNGTISDLFAWPYVGVDIVGGRGVDVECWAASLPFPDRTFTTAVSTEMLEHDLTPWDTLAEIHRVLIPGGWLILTARGFDQRGAFGYHEHPADWWRYSCGGLCALVRHVGFVLPQAVPDLETPGVFLTARRRG